MTPLAKEMSRRARHGTWLGRLRYRRSAKIVFRDGSIAYWWEPRFWGAQ